MGPGGDDEQELLRSVALQNAQSILLARRRAEAELLKTKEELELRSKELARSLSMMRATLEATTDAILVTDAQGRVTDYNEKFVALWNLPRAVIGSLDHRRVLDHICPFFKDAGQCHAKIDAIYAASPLESFDLLELTDGRVFERYSRIQFIEQQNVGRVWSVRDVTERRRTEDALRDESRILELLNQTGTVIASQLELRALVQAVTDAATQLSGARFGAFFYTSKQANGEELLLYTLSGAPREAFDRFGHPRATSLFGPTFRGEGPVRCDDVTQDPRYGTLGPHHGMPLGHLPVRSYLAVSVKSRVGEIIGGLFFGHPEAGVFTDRTERIITGVAAQAAVAIDNARLFQRAQDAVQLRDDFLAIASHELKTPLTPLRLQIQSLSRLVGKGELATVPPERLRSLTRIADRQIARLTSLIEELLDVTRISAGKLRLEREIVDLVRLANEAVERHAVQLALSRCVARVEAPPRLEGKWDPLRVEQVFTNLITNAARYAPGKPIEISVRQEAGEAVVAVRDAGVGIAEQDRERIFQRYEQVKSTASVGGLGLGLFITRQIVEAHGGSIRVASGPGPGATFIVRLPLDDQPR